MNTYALTFVVLLALLLLCNLLMTLLRRRGPQLAFNVALLALLAANAYLLQTDSTTYFGMVSVNPFSAFFFIAITSGILLANLLAYKYSDDYCAFSLLASFALFGGCLVVAANSLIAIFIGLESVSLPSTFIMLSSKKRGLEPAMKFFIMASIATAVTSFAIALVYGASGTLALEPHQQGLLLSLAAVLFIASLGVEAAVFPFSVFIPDVYQGSDAHVVSLLGGVNKSIGMAALIQVSVILFISSEFAFTAIAVLAAITMLFGNLIALSQKSLKRMLAYSSIAQVGYVLVGIATKSQLGIEASLFQIFAHAFLFIGALGILAWLEKSDRKDLDDLVGLYKEDGLAAGALSIFVLSMAGLPFTTGFIGKFTIFLSAVSAGLSWLAVIGVGCSIISLLYYVRIVMAVFTDKLGKKRSELDPATAIVVAVCLGITIAFGIFPQPLLGMASGGAAYIMALVPH
ncbi:F(420)H(2) dehydrogenase subunit N [uncultured archaeon]|nr:F(420)H(2) dehydrogenase subunit N [uncultured archaeon]